MYRFEREKKLKIGYCKKIKNRFYSYCRNVSDYKIENDEKANELIEKYKKIYKNININSYIDLLDVLSKDLINNIIDCNEAICILVKTIDPNYTIYTIYDEACTNEELKTTLLQEFHFYDPSLVELEKKYLKDNNLDDQYFWTYKK